MSEEGGATPTETTLNVALVRVTPKPGKGALGTRWFRESVSYPGSEPGFLRGTYRDEAVGKPCEFGVYACRRFSFAK